MQLGGLSLDLFQILKARIWDSDQPDLRMDWEGAMQVDVEEHQGCYVTCGITAADCNNRQVR